MADFTLKGKVKIKSKTAEQWKEWQSTNILDEGQLGFVKDKGYLVCGNNIDSDVFLDENINLSSSGKYRLNSETGKIDVGGMGEIPLFTMAPMYGYGYKSDQDSSLVYKRKPEEYTIPENTLLLLYDNYEDFDISIINPDDVRS